jgi:subtilisin family serine protease
MNEDKNFAYIPNQFIIKTKGMGTAAVKKNTGPLKDLNKKYSIEKIINLGEDDYQMNTKGSRVYLKDTYKLFTGSNDIEKIVEDYNNHPDIEYAQPDYIYSYPEVPNDPYYNSYNLWRNPKEKISDQWSLDAISGVDFENAWNISKGDGAVVAILDSGFDVDHPDLKGKFKKTYDLIDFSGASRDEDFFVEEEDYFGFDEDVKDLSGHGTKVAGIIGARTDNKIGIAGAGWNTKIIGLKVGIIYKYDEDDLGNSYYDSGQISSSMALGFRYATDNNADIILPSVAAKNRDWLLRDAVEYALSNDVLVVSPAGNDGENTYTYPAALNEVMAVGAVGKNDKLTSYSNYGHQIDVVAPGGESNNVYPILLLKSQDQFFSSPYVDGTEYYTLGVGTSFSTPHVAALAALIMSKRPDLNSQQVREIINSTAEDINRDQYPGRDKYIGWGKINAYKAVKKALKFNPSHSQSRYIDFYEEPRLTDNKFEIGEVRIDHKWKKVNLSNKYKDPVVFTSPLTFNGKDPAHVRLKNVKNDSFQIKVEEWKYLDGSHVKEHVKYIVFEQGEYLLPYAKILEVGSLKANHNFSKKNYMFDYAEKPIVIAQAQSLRGGQPIITRTSVGDDYFRSKVQEEERLGKHLLESIGYLVLSQGYGKFGDIGYSTFSDETVNHNWQKIFIPLINANMFLADDQSYIGSDTTELRAKYNINGNLDDFSNYIDVFLEEEQTRDNETRHKEENISGLYLKINN